MRAPHVSRRAGGLSLPALRDAALATAALGASVYAGSGGLTYFDSALTGYFAATVVACMVATYHAAAFWRRRPSAFYGRALLHALRQPRQLVRALRSARRDLIAQRSIAGRGRSRWVAHLLLSWGTLVSFAVTLPLVCGWIHFEATGERAYQVVVMSVRLGHFATYGIIGWVTFHILNLAAVAVIAGVAYFLIVRLRLRRQVGALSRFHLAPLLLLLAVAVTGLALPVTAQLGRPWLFSVAAAAHEIAVITLLATLPYGKLVHLFIRPLQVGVRMMRAESAGDARCGRCDVAMAPVAQLQGVEALLAARGFRFAGYQRLCPTCRRRQLATVHGQLLGACFQPRPVAHRVPLREAA